MEITVVGVGLPEGRRLFENVETGLMKAGVYAELNKGSLSDLPPGDRGRKLPLLYIDGKLICEGLILSVKEVQELLAGSNPIV